MAARPKRRGGHKGAPRVAVFTIVSKNYMAYARTLMSSLTKQEPRWKRFVCLCDEVGAGFDPGQESFTTVCANELDIDGFEEMAFKYSILEFNTAVKPFVFRELFDRQGFDHVVYIDPDIYVYRPLAEISKLLGAGALMVLTPHLSAPLQDDHSPSELDILRSGTFNLGFLAVGRTEATRPFLKWWTDSLKDQCVVDLEAGLFVDQKWMDLAPSLFPGVEILRHPGYNLAYWNLAHRPLSKGGDSCLVDGKPLVFAHYSGIDPQHPGAFSKHQDRFRLADIGLLAPLAQAYCSRVMANGHEECRHLPYAYDQTPSGIQLNPWVRLLYRQDAAVRQLTSGRPFETMPALANQPANSRHPEISRLLLQMWKARKDLQHTFPAPFGDDKADFIHWFALHYQKEGPTIDPVFFEPVRKGMYTPPDYLMVTGGLLRLMVGAKKLIPSRALRRGVRRLLIGRQPSDLQDVRVPEATAPVAFGANVIGYARAETGVGESARLCVQSLAAADVPFALIRYAGANVASEGDERTAHLERSANPYAVNLWHVNADQTRPALEHHGDDFCDGRYNIGVWHWELPDLRPEWQASIDALDEIWAPSHFVEHAVKKLTDKPVVYMPHGLEVIQSGTPRRGDYDLPDGPMVFLTMFDALSVPVRKNPIGVLRAFQSAFGDRQDVALVVKVNNSVFGDEYYEWLLSEIAKVPNALVIERNMSRQEVYGLLAVCDCLVSLHRSEGFGLGPFEAMALGKAVICTDWSGTTDFVTVETGLPVNYELRKLDRDYGPYSKDNLWAEPDLQHAAECMRALKDSPDLARRVGRRAAEVMRERYSPRVAGERMRARLEEIAVLRRDPLSSPPRVDATAARGRVVSTAAVPAEPAREEVAALAASSRDDSAQTEGARSSTS